MKNGRYWCRDYDIEIGINIIMPASGNIRQLADADGAFRLERPKEEGMTSMDKNEIIELIQLFCIHNDCKYRDDYSGRGMSGRTCAGIVTNHAHYIILKLTGYLIRHGITDTKEALGSICTDNMGQEFIIYFPSVSVQTNN